MTITPHQVKFRTFEESTAEDWAVISPHLNVTQSYVPEHVLEQMRYLRNDYGGFPVDRLDRQSEVAI